MKAEAQGHRDPGRDEFELSHHDTVVLLRKVGVAAHRGAGKGKRSQLPRLATGGTCDAFRVLPSLRPARLRLVLSGLAEPESGCKITVPGASATVNLNVRPPRPGR